MAKNRPNLKAWNLGYLYEVKLILQCKLLIKKKDASSSILVGYLEYRTDKNKQENKTMLNSVM